MIGVDEVVVPVRRCEVMGCGVVIDHEVRMLIGRRDHLGGFVLSPGRLVSLCSEHVRLGMDLEDGIIYGTYVSVTDGG